MSSNGELVHHEMSCLKSQTNLIKIEDLQNLPAETFKDLRDKICSSLHRRRSNCSLSFNSSAGDISVNNSHGIEVHDENSVIYVPAIEEDQLAEQIDDELERTIVPSFEASDEHEVTVVGSTKRKRSASLASTCGPLEKHPRTSFAGLFNNSVPEEARSIQVICSTPTVSTITIASKQSVELDKLSPICKDDQSVPSDGCACARKMVDACEEIKNMVGGLHQLLGADGPLSNLRKLLNLGDAFEQYQRDCVEKADVNSTTKMVLPPQPLDMTMESVKIYDNVDTFITDNIHYKSEHRHWGLKPIIIDGSNIAMAHGQDRWYSVRGLKICIDFFLRRGHQVFAFIPAHRLRRDGSDDPRTLHELVRRGLVFCTPSWEAGGRRYCSYDDRIMLQVAAAKDAVVVSRDHFRDLQAEDGRFVRLLQRGLLMPTFVGDMLIFPQDPLGRYGPTLERFLRYP